MAKRRAEASLLHDSPSKRCFRSLSGADLQLEITAPPTGGGVSPMKPPSLLSLMGCRKRPHYSQNPEKQEEAAPHHRPAPCDARKHAADVVSVQTSGSFQNRISPCKKRARDDCTRPETVIPKDKTDEDTNSEDSAYNSFQYWRVPLPELNLSLLEEVHDPSQRKEEQSKVKDCSSDAMET